MISSKWMRGTLIAAAITLAAPAIAQDDAKAAFQARYTALRAAMQAHDEAALGAIMTPDYALTDIRGEAHTRADIAAMGGRMGGGRMGGPPGGPGAPAAGAKPAGAKPDAAKDGPRPERKIDQTVVSAAVTGDVATVAQQTVMSGSREGDDGEMHTMEMTMLATDTWVRQNGAWLLKASVQTDMTAKRDGDVVFHQAK